MTSDVVSCLGCFQLDAAWKPTLFTSERSLLSVFEITTVVYSELAGRMATPRDLLRGDPAYIAPELLRSMFVANESKADPLAPRELDGRADIFSLGLVLLEMLTAKYPLDPLGLVPNRPATRFLQGYAPSTRRGLVLMFWLIVSSVSGPRR
jgi:serine/threonine protein kinase